MAENSYEGLKCRHPMTLLQSGLSGLSGLPLIEANIFTGRGRPCTLWESGRFLVPLLEIRLPAVKPCSNWDNGSFVHGKWLVAGGGGDCAIPWLRPLELRSALRNQTFVFMGDSLCRQLFLRLVSYLRGIPDQLERPFHTDAIYAFNATHDAFFNGLSWSPSMLPNPLFKAHFFWDHNANRANARRLVQNYTARILGFHYHLGDEGFMGSVPRTHGGDSRTLFMTTPNNDNVRSNDSRFDQRNAWIRQQPHLPLAAMALTRVFGRNAEDNMHFQCAFDCPALRENAYDVDPLPLLRNRLRMPFSGDCRDMVNLNMVMMIARFAAAG